MAHDTLRFIDSYRAAFERLDIEAIADHFAYPCHMSADGDPVSLQVAASREAWVPQLTRLVETYRRIGVAAATVESIATNELSPRLAVTTVHWALKDASGDLIYAFTAVYTLGAVQGTLRIAAIAHDESPKLRAAVASRQR